MLTIIISPLPKSWDTLSDGAPICITPRGTQTMICVTRKESAAFIYQSMIYDMVVLGLADIANITVAYHGNPDFPKSSDANTTGFSTNYPPSLLELSIIPVTSLFTLPVFAAADFVLGLQALTHYPTVQEMTFGVFDMTSGDPNPVANGCLAFDCSDFGQNLFRPCQENFTHPNGTVSATNLAQPSLQCSSALESTDAQDTDLGLHVKYTTTPTAKPIPVQHYAEVASDTLWQIIGAIISSHGDALMPPWETDAKLEYAIHTVVPWGQELEIFILQDHNAVENLTLGLAAGVLKVTMKAVVDEHLFLETRLDIGIVDATRLKWSPGGVGCFGYSCSSTCPGFDGATIGNGISVGGGNDPTISLRLPLGSDADSSVVPAPAASPAFT